VFIFVCFKNKVARTFLLDNGPRAVEAAPWNHNQVFTQDNVASLSKKINETFQTDFWFYKPGMDA
jgi:hypothetical protein